MGDGLRSQILVNKFKRPGQGEDSFKKLCKPLFPKFPK